MLGLLYDIHANLPALDAVLEDARRAGAQRWVLGGDYVAFGGYPEETLERLGGLPEPAVWVRGNAERWLVDESDRLEPEATGPALEACREAIGEAATAELVALPETATVDGVHYCHASPLNDMESFSPEGDPAEDERLLAGARERRVVFGHTHVGFRRTGPGGVELVNPGSIGIPFDGDVRASYALVNDEGRLEHRRVAYDNESAADRLSQRFDGASWTEIFARRVRTARI